MKKNSAATLIIFVLVLATLGQNIAKPTLTSKPLTDEQSEQVQQGIALHDAKKYSEAIAKYQEILVQNPDCARVLYELAFTYYTIREKEKAMETANRGSKYISDELPLFYEIMASVLDDYGKPAEAIKIYRDGLKQLGNDRQFAHYRSSLYFNLGQTLVKQKQYDDAREAFKASVENNYGYASPNLWLSVVYNATKYKIPAFMAASRFLSLEYNTSRSNKAAEVITDVLKPAEKDPKTGNIQIFLNIDAPKDEGDFGMYELFLGTLTTIKDDKDKDKSQDEIFVDAVGTLIALIAEDKKLGSSFVGKKYVPFMVDLKKNGHVEALAYIVLSKTGNKLATKWLQTNDEKLKKFIGWSKAYQLPGR